MESLGTFLRRGREEAGITLEQLSERTRIRRESLECLENEDLENLPTDTYVRGFVKLVCRELSLHPREGLVRYETLRERLGPPDEMTWSEERAEVVPGRLQRALEDPERVMRRARRLVGAGLWVGGTAAAVLLAWAGVTIVGHFRGEGDPPRVAAVIPTPEVPAEPAESAVQDAEDPPAKAPEAEAPAAKSAVSGKPPLPLPLEQVRLATTHPTRIVPAEILVTVKPAESIREREEAAKRAELAAAEMGNRPGEQELAAGGPPSSDDPEEDPAPVGSAPEPAGHAAEQAPPPPHAAEPASTRAAVTTPSTLPALSNPTPRARRPVAGERLRLEVVALRAVDVQVLLDGIGFPRSTSMEAGEVKTWKADSLFVLHASDGGAVRIILSGDDLGVPGRDHERLERLVIRGDR